MAKEGAEDSRVSGKPAVISTYQNRDSEKRKQAAVKARVLHCMWSGTIGGAQRAVFQFIRSQTQLSRYQPAIAYSSESGFYGEEVKKLGVEVIDFRLRRDLSLSEVYRLKTEMQRFDIHHFHSADVTTMLASVLCADVHRIYTHRSGDPTYSGKQRLRYEIVGYLARNYFEGLVGNTRRACDSAARIMRTDASRWRAIYNGIDFSMLQPTRSSAEVAFELGISVGDCMVIGTSAHLRSLKRVELLIQACAKLNIQSYRLLIVGDGPARPDLEALSKKLGIDSRTLFTGMKEQVGDYLQLMDVFVLPSGNVESFGNSAVEAMSQGLPTIVFSDGGGLVEHIRNEETGYIVSSTDELTQRLRELGTNPDLRLRLGKAARAYVTQKYSYENLVASYDDLYDVLHSN